MFGVTFKGNYWNIVTTTEVEISVLAWFFSINIFRKERAPPSPWLIWQQRTESVEYLNIWVWQGTSQYCCVGWSLVIWINLGLLLNCGAVFSAVWASLQNHRLITHVGYMIIPISIWRIPLVSFVGLTVGQCSMTYVAHFRVVAIWNAPGHLAQLVWRFISVGP